jgi:hypothetical protein
MTHFTQMSRTDVDMTCQRGEREVRRDLVMTCQETLDEAGHSMDVA